MLNSKQYEINNFDINVSLVHAQSQGQRMYNVYQNKVYVCLPDTVLMTTMNDSNGRLQCVDLDRAVLYCLKLI